MVGGGTVSGSTEFVSVFSCVVVTSVLGADVVELPFRKTQIEINYF